MSLFVNQIITAPEHLPVTVAAADETLTAAIVEELERSILFRGIVHQTRRILIDGDLPPRIEIEPTTSIVSLTRYTPDDDAEVIDPDDFMYVSTRSARNHHRAARPEWLASRRARYQFLRAHLRVRLDGHRRNRA